MENPLEIMENPKKPRIFHGFSMGFQLVFPWKPPFKARISMDFPATIPRGPPPDSEKTPPTPRGPVRRHEPQDAHHEDSTAGDANKFTSMGTKN